MSDASLHIHIHTEPRMARPDEHCCEAFMCLRPVDGVVGWHDAKGDYHRHYLCREHGERVFDTAHDYTVYMIDRDELEARPYAPVPRSALPD